MAPHFYPICFGKSCPPFTYTGVACAVGPCATMASTDFSFQHLVFWSLFQFSAAEII
jgi:hypothetical protein